jgi:hypothetical protein
MNTISTISKTLKYKYELLKDAIQTGNFDKVFHEIRAHVISNKNTYIVLTFLIVLYTLYEQDYNANTRILKISRQSGGETKGEPVTNTAPKPEASNTTPKKSGNSTGNDISKGKKIDENNNSASDTSSSSGGKGSQLAQGARGLCDGDGTIAKMCRGGKDGVTNYFKFFGYLILAGLAILSPFVIYIVLVYMMLKIMFTGLKNI